MCCGPRATHAPVLIREQVTRAYAERQREIRVDPELLRRRLAEARVGRLATVDAAGDPHVVPVCFVVDGDTVYWAVDHKPKATRRLRRIANLEAHPVAELVVDHYAEDWTGLWWIRVRADAAVLEPGVEADRALDLLAAKYVQYRERRPDGPVVRLAVRRWTSWPAGA
jgi:PPOX class probable F420-dependent enzyme